MAVTLTTSNRVAARSPGRSWDGGPRCAPLSLRGLIDWLFRDRTTGRITIAQFPNVPLWIFIVASVLRRLLDPAGTADTVLRVMATGGLAWWAADEVLRGVNPWRRLLGAGVLAAQLVKLWTR